MQFDELKAAYDVPVYATDLFELLRTNLQSSPG